MKGFNTFGAGSVPARQVPVGGPQGSTESTFGYHALVPQSPLIPSYAQHQQLQHQSRSPSIGSGDSDGSLGYTQAVSVSGLSFHSPTVIGYNITQ